jgi:hypothetical protein
MLKLWYERTDDIENSRNEVLACLDVISGLSTPDEDCDSDLHVSLTPNIESKESINDVTICDELTVEQKQQLHDLLSDYSDIFSDVPQVTNVIKHVVNTRTNDLIYKRPYPLLYAMRNQVKEEVDKMLKAGIVESSDSPYAAPVILVRKKDNMIRFCIDFRALNSETIFDPRPMPRIDEVLHSQQCEIRKQNRHDQRLLAGTPMTRTRNVRVPLLHHLDNINFQLCLLGWLMQERLSSVS